MTAFTPKWTEYPEANFCSLGCYAWGTSVVYWRNAPILFNANRWTGDTSDVVAQRAHGVLALEPILFTRNRDNLTDQGGTEYSGEMSPRTDRVSISI